MLIHHLSRNSKCDRPRKNSHPTFYGQVAVQIGCYLDKLKIVVSLLSARNYESELDFLNRIYFHCRFQD